MNSKRPRLNIPFEPIDIFIELISVSMLLIMWIYAIYNYAELPDTIPTHFDGKGEIDDYGSKLTIWIVPGIATIMYVGLFILNKFPHFHNYMINITEENALKNYRFSTRILRTVNFLCVLLMVFITYKIIESAKGTDFTLGNWFLPVVVGVSIILPIVLLIYMKRLNKD
jgi:uncharacterized membrane protein